MVIKKYLLAFTLLLLVLKPIMAYKIIYAEQWYRLYHQHLNRYAEDEAQNIRFLEEALKAPFANPLYALTTINNENEHEYYRYFFKMHANLQMVRSYIALASKYDRAKAYFYNAPWRIQNIASLNIAEEYYKRALFFWNETLNWREQLGDSKFKWIYFNELSFWHSEVSQINDGSLNFELIIGKHLTNLTQKRSFYEAME